MTANETRRERVKIADLVGIAPELRTMTETIADDAIAAHRAYLWERFDDMALTPLSRIAATDVLTALIGPPKSEASHE